MFKFLSAGFIEKVYQTAKQSLDYFSFAWNLGHDQRQNNGSKSRKSDFSTVARFNLTKKLVPTPPPPVIKPSPLTAKATARKPLAAVRKVVIIAKPKMPTGDPAAQPVLHHRKPDGYSGHFRTVIGNGRQVLHRDVQVPRPPPYTSPRTIRNKMVPPRSAMRTRSRDRRSPKHVWFHEVKLGKL